MASGSTPLKGASPAIDSDDLREISGWVAGFADRLERLRLDVEVSFEAEENGKTRTYVLTLDPDRTTSQRKVRNDIVKWIEEYGFDRDDPPEMVVEIVGYLGYREEAE